ncbi:MAG: Mov34/MPN/PAD-1 family protein [Planctomycetales bacterium]|nr:Mov34/MPN/PAD-1 family protein [Planctomycetales bacterium]MCA9162008.1 Mov34/MPN/PAD-1 family protein [Planctomycetales bacterium]MCA9225025.1 Mov34/MPN/PAD-1 family protein [Planctomycetales bacterium]
MPDVQPVAKPLPVAPGRQRVRTIGRLRPHCLPIFVHESVLESILDYSEQDLRQERGGFLIGGFYHDQRQYIEVRSFLPATETRAGAASLRFTHDTWASLTREVDQRFPDELVVGWQHTHPNLGVFLSGYDLFIHRNFFRETWQVALVVDPVRQEFRFFQWQADEIVDCGFICVQSESHG